MPRLLSLVAACFALSGCLRVKFDECVQSPPHPECKIDGGTDARVVIPRDGSSDAELSFDASSDASSTLDSAVIDAGVSEDAETTSDAPSSTDASADAMM